MPNRIEQVIEKWTTEDGEIFNSHKEAQDWEVLAPLRAYSNHIYTTGTFTVTNSMLSKLKDLVGLVRWNIVLTAEPMQVTYYKPVAELSWANNLPDYELRKIHLELQICLAILLSNAGQIKARTYYYKEEHQLWTL